MPENSDTKKVLILDDDPDVVKVLKIVLEKEGYDVLPLTSASEALETLLSGDVDMAIIDREMEKLDVPAFITKASEAASLDIPLLLLCASEEEGMAELRGFAGTAEVLAKPVAKGELVDRMRLLLGQRRSTWRLERI
ncbi:MAG: response regulator transcription factor [Planctomycetes bacterium]|nr:response regulator transcription factor [Planctomycetota bacterium]